MNTRQSSLKAGKLDEEINNLSKILFSILVIISLIIVGLN
jgi:hypothetical protein